MSRPDHVPADAADTTDHGTVTVRDLQFGGRSPSTSGLRTGETPPESTADWHGPPTESCERNGAQVTPFRDRPRGEHR